MSSMMPPGRRGVAIVTGATSGIGQWVAKQLHDKNYCVALCGRREKEGLANAAELDPSGKTAVFVQCDVANYNSQSALFRKVWEEWNRLDLVVANAGVVDGGSKYKLAESPQEPDTTCTDVIWKGTMFSIGLATHYMRKNLQDNGGKILITGSVLGIHPNPTFPEYCAVKAALNHYIRCIAPILVQYDTTINCISPGPIDTGAMPDFAAAFSSEHMTLKSNLMKCFDLYIEDMSRKTGTITEVAHDVFSDCKFPSPGKGSSEECWTNVHEPWFKTLHGITAGSGS